MSDSSRNPTSDKTHNPALIIRAVKDQHDNTHYQFAGDDKPLWLSYEEIGDFDKSTASKLAQHGIMALTTATRNKIKKAAETASVDESALVANRPGWVTDTVYVLGDGEVLRSNDGKEVIVTFEPDPRCRAAGTLEGWRTGLDPLVAVTPTLSFLLAYSFVPILLRFAPPDMHNPFIELVGPPECGKTTLAVLAASTFAGGTDQLGGADTWNATAGGLEDARGWFSDRLQVLDEQNEQDEAVRTSSSATFKNASGSRRRRHGTARGGQSVRLATLSTSNDPNSNLGKPGTAAAAAAATRRIGIVFTDRILTNLPPGCGSTAEAIVNARQVIDENHAVAARAFVEEVIREAAKDVSALRSRIAHLILRHSQNKGIAQIESERLRKVLGLVRAAGELASEWNVMPKDAISIRQAVEDIVPLVQSCHLGAGPPAVPTADEILNALVQKLGPQAESFARINGELRKSSAKLPLPPALLWVDNHVFYKSAKVKDPKGKSVLYVRPDIVRAHFGVNSTALLKELRDQGRLVGEGGSQPKLQIKTPVGLDLGAGGRVYAFRLAD